MIGDNKVTTPKIHNNAITTAKIASNAVTTAKVDNNAITTAKIADDAVTTAKVDNNAITTAKIHNNAITTAKIQNNSVTGAKIDDMGAAAGEILTWDGNDWAPAAGSSGWTLDGNAVDSTDFIGTVNDEPLRFVVNNTQSGIIASGAPWNTALGQATLVANTTGNSLVAIGNGALHANTTGVRNTAVGSGALLNNTVGKKNTAMGNDAMRDNTTGENNTATGYNALFHNTTGYANTAHGIHTLFSNTTGGYNTAIGNAAMEQNTTGDGNIGIGPGVLYNTTMGSVNVGAGNGALFYNTTGTGNIGIGNLALQSNTDGNHNTAVGSYTDASDTAFSNSGAFGFQAYITASNQYRFGNPSVTSIGGAVAWSSVSDGRFKTGVDNNVPGLAFIEKLRPVTYYLNTDKLNRYLGLTETNAAAHQPGSEPAPFYTGEGNKTTANALHNGRPALLRTGFIAQEVAAAAKAVGFEFDGVDKPKNDQDLYGLRYAEFVVPLVKAVQEQQAMIEQLQQANRQLEARITQLETR